MEIDLREDGGATLTLEPRDARLLATALERSLFLDTPPHLQGATMEFAEQLLRALRPDGLAADR